MRLESYNFSAGFLVPLKNEDWAERQRIAGNCVSSIMSKLQKLIDERAILSMKEVDGWIENEILSKECTPTFKNYKGFPASVCISINDEMVHGIPDDRKLVDGDVVKFDFGATFKGAIADSAITCIYGKPKKYMDKMLTESVQQSLYDGIKSIKLGKKIGSIGFSINKRLKNDGFVPIVELGGHGIDEDAPHAHFFVSNKEESSHGFGFYPGMTFAIEPIAVHRTKSSKINKKSDGWTVMGDGVSSHWEHTIYLHRDCLEIMTHRDDEKIDRFLSLE